MVIRVAGSCHPPLPRCRSLPLYKSISVANNGYSVQTLVTRVHRQLLLIIDIFRFTTFTYIAYRLPNYFHIENHDKDRKFCLLPKSKKYSWCENRETSQRYRDKGAKPKEPLPVDTTLTPLRAQHPATGSKAQKRKPLRYAGFATVCNPQKHPFSPFQGGCKRAGRHQPARRARQGSS
jgi:hypothetical protein